MVLGEKPNAIPICRDLADALAQATVLPDYSILTRVLNDRGISVTGVTKATLGSADIAAALLRAGMRSIGDSRIENIESMRGARVPATITACERLVERFRREVCQSVFGSRLRTDSYAKSPSARRLD